MAYEYAAEAKIIRLTKSRRVWQVEFNGRRGGSWNSPDAAAKAAAVHASGLSDWDRTQLYAPADVLDWRPLGDSL